MRVCEVEAHTVRRDTIERGRGRDAAVAAERIRAKCVDRNQQDVLIGDRAQVHAHRLGTREGEPRDDAHAGDDTQNNHTPENTRTSWGHCYRLAAARAGDAKARRASARTASASWRRPNIVKRRAASE